MIFSIAASSSEVQVCLLLGGLPLRLADYLSMAVTGTPSRVRWNRRGLPRGLDDVRLALFVSVLPHLMILAILRALSPEPVGSVISL